MKAFPVIINTDTMAAGDDINAITMLLLDKSVFVVGILAENGNVFCTEAYSNVIKLLNDLDCSIPVGIGDINLNYLKNKPQLYEGYFHGAMSKPFSLSNDSFSNVEPASTLLLRLSKEFEGALNIVCIAPSTNIADALLIDPGLADRINHVYFMGGAFEVHGNASPCAEFNVWFDAHATSVVLNTSWPVTLLPLNATERHRVPADFFKRLNLPSKFRPLRKDLKAWDELLAAIVMNRNIIKKSFSASVEVILENNAYYGKTEISKKNGHIEIVTDIRNDWL